MNNGYFSTLTYNLNTITLIFKTWRGLAPKYQEYFNLIKLPLAVHFVTQIALTSWFHFEELLWFSLDPLPQLVPLFGMHFLLQFVPLLYQTSSFAFLF